MSAHERVMIRVKTEGCRGIVSGVDIDFADGKQAFLR
jgi:hypothetical protein